ncbi:ankyrin repeat domain-containing protein [Vibrio breoganii]
MQNRKNTGEQVALESLIDQCLANNVAANDIVLDDKTLVEVALTVLESEDHRLHDICKGADFSSQANQVNLLSFFARNRDLSVVRTILEYAKDDVITELDKTYKNPAFFYIMKLNEPELTQICVDKIEDIVVNNKHGQNALSFYFKYASFVQQKNLNILLTALKERLNPHVFLEYINDKDFYGRSPISQLVVNASFEKDRKKKQRIIRFLPIMAGLGCQVDTTNKAGTNLCLSATIDNDTETYQALRNLNASPYMQSATHNSCLQFAFKHLNLEIAEDVVSHASEGELDVQDPAEHPIFALSSALRRKGVSIEEKAAFEALAIRSLKLSADDLNIANEKNDGHTLLIAAIKCGLFDLARELIADGADINQANDYGVTPAMYCVYHMSEDQEGYTRLLEDMMLKGINYEMREETKGNTVVDLARYAGYAQLAGKLLYRSNLNKAAQFIAPDRDLDVDEIGIEDVELESQDAVLEVVQKMDASTIEQLHREDIENTHMSDVIKEKLEQSNREKSAEKDAKIAEGKRLIVHSFSQHLPLALFAGAFAEGVLEEYSGSVAMASVASVSAVSSYLLGFTNEDRSNIKLAIDDTVERIDERILEPIRDLCRQAHVIACNTTYSACVALSAKWEMVKEGFVKLGKMVGIAENIKEAQKVESAESDVKTELLKAIDQAGLCEADMVRLTQAFRAHDDDRLRDDGDIVKSILEASAVIKESGENLDNSGKRIARVASQLRSKRVSGSDYAP